LVREGWFRKVPAARCGTGAALSFLI